MIELPLSGGRAIALIDDIDAERVMSGPKWQVREIHGTRTRSYWYASRKMDGTTQMLHRFVMSAPSGMVVDHINSNGLDNRRENLRICTRAQNQQNRRKSVGASSRFLGVYWHKGGRKWVAEIQSDHLGLFVSERAAATAYDLAASTRYGEYAHLNFPMLKNVS